MSPYSIMAGNPIMYTDHLGDTVLFGIVKGAAGGNGHLGMSYQDGNGDWNYFSQGATDNPDNPGTVGMLLFKDAEGGVDSRPIRVQEEQAVLDSKGNATFDANGKAITQTVIRNPTKKEVEALMKNGSLGYKYDDLVQLNTSKKQDKEIGIGARTEARSYGKGNDGYGVYFNNCVDACQDAVQGKSNISLPMDWSPVPNSYFEKLKEFEKEFNKSP